MRRPWFLMLALTASTLVAGPASADWFFGTTRRNSNWPAPYNCQDRRQVEMPFQMMVANGWERQLLIGDRYFKSGTAELTSAGINKVKNVVRYNRPEVRMFFVQTAASPDLTAARIDAVQQAAARYGNAGELPQVSEINTREYSVPAQSVNRTLDQYYNTQPDPRLPSSNGANGTTGGSSSSSGASGS